MRPVDVFPASTLLFCGLKGSDTDGKFSVPTRAGKEVLLCWLLALGMAEGHLPQLCRALAASPFKRCTALFSVWGSGQWAHCHPAGISAGIMAEYFEIVPFWVFPSWIFTVVASVNLCLPHSNVWWAQPLFGRQGRSLIYIQLWSQRLRDTNWIVPQGACVVLLSFNPLPLMGVLREMKNWVLDLSGGLLGGFYTKFNILMKKVRLLSQEKELSPQTHLVF